MSQETIDELIALKLVGEIDQEGEQELNAWISQSEENRNHFAEMQMLWDAGLEDENFEPNVNAAWDKVSTELNLGQGQAKVIAMPSRTKSLIYRIAASIVILLGVTWIYTSKLSSPEMIRVASLANEQKEITLPDNSKVYLNANSVLEYPEKFKGDSREIKLEGEAFFEVQRDEAHPFIIHTSKAYTKVLGTSFNVLALKNSNNVVVSVKTGKVEVGIDENHKVQVTPGYTAKVDLAKNEVESMLTKSEIYLSWKTKEMNFDNVTIAEFIEFVQNYYHVEIKANDEILNCHFTGNFKEVSLTDLLNVLELSNGITYEIKDSIVYIKGNPCTN